MKNKNQHTQRTASSVAPQFDITRQTNTIGIWVRAIWELPTTHNLGKLLVFYCANCGKILCGCYEKDSARGGGIDEEWRYCSKCGSPLDFGEFYHKPKQPDPPSMSDDYIKFEE